MIEALPVRVRWSQARRILAVRVDNLGDVLMTTPALSALKKGPDGMPRHVTLLTSLAGAALQPHLKDIDDVIACDVPWTKGDRAGPRSAEDDHRLLARLTGGRFDAAVIFTVCTQSALPAALMCRLAGIPLRLAHSRENPYELLSDWVRDRELVANGMRHEVRRQLDLVRAVGFECDDERLRFDLRPSDFAAVAGRLRAAGLEQGQRYLVVHPGASASSRRYAPDRFGTATREIARQRGWRIVVAGSEAERPLVDAVLAAAGASALDFCGVMNLGELAALIAGAEAFVCNNSGPMHVAAAVGTPVLAAYALTNPQHTPWAVDSRVMSHDVPCRDCLQSVCPEPHHACLNGVTAAVLVEAGLSMAGRSASAR